MREQEVVIVVTVPADLSHLDKVPLLVHLEDVDSLVLDGQNCQSILVEVKSLVVGEKYFVNLECGLVAQSAFLDVHHVEGVVLQGVPGVGADTLVVPVLVVHRHVGLLGHEGCGADDDELAVVSEERALSVELLVTGRHTHGVLEFEESVEHHIPHPLAGLGLLTPEELTLSALEQVCGRGGALVAVDLQGGLVRREGDKLPPVWAEFPEETGGLLNIDQSKVRDDIQVKTSQGV